MGGTVRRRSMRVLAMAVLGSAVVLGGALGAYAGDGHTVSIGDATQNEGDVGSSDFVFTVALSAPAAVLTQVDFETAPDNATAGTDYIPTSGTVFFLVGESTKEIRVPVLGDTDVEPNERFFVNITGVVAATVVDGQGVGTIVNDDAYPLSVQVPALGAVPVRGPVEELPLPPRSAGRNRVPLLLATAVLATAATAAMARRARALQA